MVGIPIFAGFIPKLYFAAAAFHMGWRTWAVLLALALSTLLNVLYFLYTTLLLWVPEAETARTRRLSWAAVLWAHGPVPSRHGPVLSVRKGGIEYAVSDPPAAAGYGGPEPDPE